MLPLQETITNEMPPVDQTIHFTKPAYLQMNKNIDSLWEDSLSRGFPACKTLEE